MSKHFEIEIKSLLGNKEKADELRKKIEQRGGKLKTTATDKQRNHYFTYSDLSKFHDDVLPHIVEARKEIFSDLVKRGKNFSIRTRETNDNVLLVMKVSLDDQTSSNGVSRIEFEAEMPISLEELDQMLIKSGLQYQAKWSREREEYRLGETNICIDKNAGYGYLAEFEKVLENEVEIAERKAELLSLLSDFGLSELPQDRLERMFAFYNSHWPEYYGTDKVFNVE